MAIFLMSCAVKPGPDKSSSTVPDRQEPAPENLRVEIPSPGKTPADTSIPTGPEPVEPIQEVQSDLPEFSLPELCLESVNLKPDEPVTTAGFLLCTRLLVKNENLDQARELVKKIPEVGLSGVQSYEYLYLNGQIHFLSGEYELAENIWQAILKDKNTLSGILEDTEKQMEIFSLLKGIENATLKKDVEALYHNYYSGAHHPQVSKQAIKVLKKTKSKILRTRVKKLVQNAWERDEKNVTAVLDKIKSDYALNKNTEQSINELETLRKKYPEYNGAEFDQVRNSIQNNLTPPVSSESRESMYSTADSLVKAGRFVDAQKIINKLLNTALDKKARSLMEKSGNLYCADKRKTASQKFSASKSATGDKQLNLLLKAKSELENCLTYFPDLSIAKKVRKNLVMINKQTENLTAKRE